MCSKLQRNAQEPADKDNKEVSYMGELVGYGLKYTTYEACLEWKLKVSSVPDTKTDWRIKRMRLQFDRLMYHFKKEYNFLLWL